MINDINNIEEFCLISTEGIHSPYEMEEYITPEAELGFSHISYVFCGKNPWGKGKITAILTKDELAEHEMAEKLALYSLFKRLQYALDRTVAVPQNIQLENSYIEETIDGVKVWRKIQK